MDIRRVNTDIWLSEIADILKSGNEAPLTVTGSSMLPFLRNEKDAVLLSGAKSVRKGDVALYKRENGQYVLHRVTKRKKDGLYFCGDAQYSLEGPLPETCILAVVVKARWRGKWIGKGHPVWFFFEKIWPNILPIRKILVRLYLKKST